MTRLPAMTQFLLAPLPALITGLGYFAWRWTQSSSGAEFGRTEAYHELGWMVLPLTAVAGALFVAAIERGIKGRSSGRYLAATLLMVASLLVLTYARTATLSS